MGETDDTFSGKCNEGRDCVMTEEERISLSVKTHSGVRQALGKEFVMTGLVSKEQARFFSILFDNRQTGDYDDFIMMTEEKVRDLYPQAVDFVKSLEGLIGM